MNELFYVREGYSKDASQIVDEYWRHEASTEHLTKVEAALTNMPSAVAVINEKIVGFAYCQKFAPDILEIDNLFVNELHRNRHIGSLLLKRIELAASEYFSGLILVNSDLYQNPVVNKQNPANFYLRHGFQLVMDTSASRVFLKAINKDEGIY